MKQLNNTNAIWGQVDQPKTSNDKITYYGDYHIFEDIDISQFTDEVLIWHKPEFSKEEWRYGLYGIKNSKDSNYIEEKNVMTIELNKKKILYIYHNKYFKKCNHSEIIESIIFNYNYIINYNDIIDIQIYLYLETENTSFKNYILDKYNDIFLEKPLYYDYCIKTTIYDNDYDYIYKNDTKYYYISHDISERLKNLSNVYFLIPLTKNYIKADILPFYKEKQKTNIPYYIIQGKFNERRNINLLLNILKTKTDLKYKIKIIGKNSGLENNKLLLPFSDKIIYKHNLDFIDYHKEFLNVYCIIPLITKSSNPTYYSTKLTSSINYATGYNLKCLIDKNLQDIYQLNNVEVFDDETNISEAFSKTLIHYYNSKPLNIALVIYGQFRNYKKYLEHNLNSIYAPILKNNIIHVFILSSKDNKDNSIKKNIESINGNYSKNNEYEIIEIFKKYNCIVKVIEYWENLPQYHAKAKDVQSEYNNKCKITNILPNQIDNKGYNNFLAEYWYRIYITFLLKINYSKKYNINYDLNLFFRPFDTIIFPLVNDNIIINKLNHIVINNIILTIVDFLFIANNNIINQMLDFFMNFHNYVTNDSIWNNTNFCKEFNMITGSTFHVIKKPTYCSEVILFNYIYNNINYESLNNIFYNYLMHYNYQNSTSYSKLSNSQKLYIENLYKEK
jgi:hypothetical protein